MSENIIHAVLHRQGRKALEKKGQTEDDHAVEDVRRYGAKRIALRAGAAAVLAVVGTGFGLFALKKQDGANAAQARADVAAYNHTIYGADPSRTGSAPATGEGQAPAATASGTAAGTETTPVSTTPEDETAATTTTTTTVPAQGAWQPTPGAQPAPTSPEAGTASQGPTGGVGAEAPQDSDPSGGVSSN